MISSMGQGTQSSTDCRLTRATAAAQPDVAQLLPPSDQLIATLVTLAN